jgi:hypothetical protein
MPQSIAEGIVRQACVLSALRVDKDQIVRGSLALPKMPQAVFVEIGLLAERQQIIIATDLGIAVLLAEESAFGSSDGHRRRIRTHCPRLV